MADKCMKGIITCVYGKSAISNYAKTPLQKIIEMESGTKPHWINPYTKEEMDKFFLIYKRND